MAPKGKESSLIVFLIVLALVRWHYFLMFGPIRCELFILVML